MELTIEQALQQGVAAHKEGKLQEAERLYRAILQSQPLHPDANHNLGVLAVSVKKAGDALPLFKTALDANPKVEQFWLSYIDALIKEQQYETSRQVIAEGKKQGFAEDKLNVLEARLTSSADTKAPPQAEMDNLLEYFQAGRFSDAEKLSLKITQDFPRHPFAWKVLGAVLAATEKSEAVDANQTAVALSPQDAEAHHNLGITLKELGRLDEAEASFGKAIALKPGYAGAHNKLLECLFLQDKKSIFFDKLDYLINQDKPSALIGSLACRSALKYGVEKPNSFCTNPLNYVLHNDLNTRCDFEKSFVEKATSILNDNRVSHRRQSLLVNGKQTSGNIFDIKNNDTNEIQNIIRVEVEKYRTKFKESEEGLIKKMPTEYSLYGWLISMKSGGNLKPHIHTEGWLSGSIYINVPQKLKVNSGNLVVSLGEDNDATDTRKNEKKTINVVTGSMVLFPASLMHYTVPFESEEERVVLAFDVKEK